MTKGKKKSRPIVPHPKGFYPLAEVKAKIEAGDVFINGNALRSAQDCFGWETGEILDAYLKLKPDHFYKTDNSKTNPNVVIDIYKANAINGESIYTHFYIDDTFRKLVINSFKTL